MNKKQLAFVEAFTEGLTKMRLRVLSDQCPSGCHKFLIAVDKKFDKLLVEPSQTPDQLLDGLAKHFADGAEFYRRKLSKLADEDKPAPEQSDKKDSSVDADAHLDDMPEAIRDLIQSLKGVNGISVEVVSVKKKPQ